MLRSPVTTLPPANSIITTLNAAFVGSTSTSVLRFEGTPVTVGTAITPTTAATTGTVFAITERGLYRATFICQATAADGTSYGFSKNGTGTTLTAPPTLVLSSQILQAATQVPNVNTAVLLLSVDFAVDSAEAAVSGGCLMRFHATDDGGTVPGELVVATARASIFRLGDYEG